MNAPSFTQVQACLCCGSKKLSFHEVLWDALIKEWALSAYEVAYINRQQGLQCGACGSNLRTMALGLAVCRCFGHPGPFVDFIKQPLAQKLKVLEINEAGHLTQFLKKLPGHVIGSYPEVDMMRMPYAEGQFNVVVHSDTLEHVPQPVAALSECRRVLAPGGFCAFTIPMIVDRLTRSRAGLGLSYHGSASERGGDWAVQTEYGSDAWKHLFLGGFRECRLVAAEFPSALAFVGTA